MDHALHYFNAFASQFENLLKDVPDARWAEQPAGIPNHAAWTIGHLSCGNHFGITALGADSGLPADEWGPLMSIGSQPVADRAAYPAQDVLWQTLKDTNAKLTAAVKSASDAQLSQVTENEDFRAFFPTTGHLITYLMTCHPGQHYGQLQVWKRAAGMVQG